MYQIIAVGVTGYTGRFVAKHLAERQDAEQVYWAIAGRNTEKLQKLKRDLNLGNDVGIITVDSTKPKDADLLAKQAKVIITTVGPYSLYGEELVRACAESGTHLVDITGEILWVHDMLQRYEGTAEKSGAKLVNCSGFDSIPADVGTCMAWKYFNDQYGPETKFTDFRSVLLKAGVGPSGGTIASVLLVIKTIWEGGRKDLDRFNDKYLLVSSGGDTKNNAAPRPVHNVSSFEEMVLPFFLCSSGFQGSLLNEDGKDPYNDLRFSEVTAVPDGGVKGAIEASLSAMVYFLVVATGETKEGKVVKAFGQVGCLFEEMGYRGTGRMVCEMAFSLLDLAKRGEEGKGGFYTPASAGREVLLDRLRNQGFTFRMGNEKAEWPKKKVRVEESQKKNDIYLAVPSTKEPLDMLQVRE